MFHSGILDKCKIEFKNRVFLAGNPSEFEIDEIRFGVISTDFILHTMSKSTILNSTPQGKLKDILEACLQ